MATASENEVPLRTFKIGIGGPSSSGKSTLSCLLRVALHNAISVASKEVNNSKFLDKSTTGPRVVNQDFHFIKSSEQKWPLVLIPAIHYPTRATTAQSKDGVDRDCIEAVDFTGLLHDVNNPRAGGGDASIIIRLPNSPVQQAVDVATTMIKAALVRAYNYRKAHNTNDGQLLRLSSATGLPTLCSCLTIVEGSVILAQPSQEDLLKLPSGDEEAIMDFVSQQRLAQHALRESLDLALFLPVPRDTAYQRRFARAEYRERSAANPHGRLPKHHWRYEWYFEHAWDRYTRYHAYLLSPQDDCHRVTNPSHGVHIRPARLSSVEESVVWAAEIIAQEIVSKECHLGPCLFFYLVAADPLIVRSRSWARELVLLAYKTGGPLMKLSNTAPQSRPRPNSCNPDSLSDSPTVPLDIAQSNQTSPTLPPPYFMQLEFPESSKRAQETSSPVSPKTSLQDGFHELQHDGTNPGQLQQRSRSTSPQPVSLLAAGCDGASASADGVNAGQLEKRLRRLSLEDTLQAPGHRISEYENALTPSTPRQALGFKVIRRANPQHDGPQLADFPNEILTHILSHLHPDSHSAVALVSRRFYTLVTTPHAWRMAFQRFFPGQDALLLAGKPKPLLDQDDSEFIRSEVRHFTRLTVHASWRSEYLLRTKLLRSLARGKPGSTSGGIGSSARSSQSGKKLSAVLTYNSKLPSMVTNAHATFASSSKKPPRVVHGAADLNVCSASDPTSGKVEKWGLDDPFAFAQLDEVVPQLLPYGVGEGPAAVPNVMDVSQPFGVVGGEGFPGGRVFFRPTGVFRGKYLGQEPSIVDAHPDIPKIPELSEAISSVWIAKSNAVPSVTQLMVGILTGSTLGIVTAFSLGTESSASHYANGAITARWVLSPGVPIISIVVDDGYSQKRKVAGRVWAVALNALGEVYYLTQPPTPLASKSKAEDATKCAWHAGRSTYWQLVDATRRQARPDESGRNALRGAYSPRSPSNGMNLKKDQMVAEAREIEKFLRYKPNHFRKVCNGWDMRRRLEVDFAADDGHGFGEGIFVIECGLEEDHRSAVTRFTRVVPDRADQEGCPTEGAETPVEPHPTPSLFGGGPVRTASPTTSGSPLLKQVLTSSGTQSPVLPVTHGLDDWRETKLLLPNKNAKITATSIDMSLYGLMITSEDPLASAASISDIPATPTAQAPSDIPGRRARFFGVGTSLGSVLLWNMREGHLTDGLQPVRIIQTESPEISSLAISALYLVHGGSDGLVQAWDPLASVSDPIRTLNARSTGRVPRHMLNVNLALQSSNFAAAGALYLDPDPTVLRGIVCFGAFVRYWAYSSTGQPAGRKRRLRHSDVHNRSEGRRFGGGVKGYIAAETEELRLEQEHKAREQTRLRARFGVGLADLTEEEALRYAEMVSQESFLLDEQRRTSASDTGSAFDTTSTSGRSLDTVTPDPSVSGVTPPAASTSAAAHAPDDESDYELQIQQALRLSLLEGVNDAGQSPREHSSESYEFPVMYKEKRGKRSPSTPSSSQTPVVQRAGSSGAAAEGHDMDDDLRLALELSLAEEESRKLSQASASVGGNDFPALAPVGKGKGKERAF
ncbi:hypothetical protein JX266_002681 [Neoarthrinium moseri]|nr:hypothetical protein JX266_002681 [Neoarthrinium moseri]